jgi:hypothetical protein
VLPDFLIFVLSSLIATYAEHQGPHVKKSILIGLGAALFSLFASAHVWIGGDWSNPKIMHSTCEIILDEDFYEDLSVDNIELLEHLKAYGFTPIRRSHDTIGQYLYLKKTAKHIIIYIGATKDDAKLWHGYGCIPFCEKSKN